MRRPTWNRSGSTVLVAVSLVLSWTAESPADSIAPGKSGSNGGSSTSKIDASRKFANGPTSGGNAGSGASARPTSGGPLGFGVLGGNLSSGTGGRSPSGNLGGTPATFGNGRSHGATQYPSPTGTVLDLLLNRQYGVNVLGSSHAFPGSGHGHWFPPSHHHPGTGGSGHLVLVPEPSTLVIMSLCAISLLGYWFLRARKA
jgi:hypothetical protein